MTVPSGFFGGNSDGAMRMESWLDRMCADCVHNEAVHPSDPPGLGCLLPCLAYDDPNRDIVEWSTDADRIPVVLRGLMCMSHEPRPVPVADQRPSPDVPGQLELIGGDR